MGKSPFNPIITSEKMALPDKTMFLRKPFIPHTPLNILNHDHIITYDHDLNKVNN